MPLQPFHRRPPLRCRRLADGVLVAEHADFLNGLAGRDGLQPVDGDNVFRFLFVVGELLVVVAVARNLAEADLALGGVHHEVAVTLRAAGHAPYADEAGAGNLDPDAVAGIEQLQRPAVPSVTAATDEAAFHGIVPRAFPGVGAEGMVKLPVPGLVRAILHDRGTDLGLDRVEQPGAADQLFVAVGEDLEAEEVDRDVALAEVSDDALGAGVERGRDDDDLVALVERVLVERQAEALLEVLAEVPAGGEARTTTTRSESSAEQARARALGTSRSEYSKASATNRSPCFWLGSLFTAFTRLLQTYQIVSSNLTSFPAYRHRYTFPSLAR